MELKLLRTKRLLAILLTVIMTVSLFCNFTLADETSDVEEQNRIQSENNSINNSNPDDVSTTVTPTTVETTTSSPTPEASTNTTTGTNNTNEETGASGFIDRLYSFVLDRHCDASGKEYWLDLLQTGEMNGADVAYGFFFSEEFLNKNVDDNTYINLLYRVFMDRNGDAGGFQYWIDKMNNEDYSRLDVFHGFTDSNEWANICVFYGIISGGNGVVTVIPPASEGIKTFVTSLYTDCLDRAPDRAGFEEWCNQLAAMQISGKEAAYGFFFSDEFISKTEDMVPEEIITIFYRVFLNRAPDSQGIAYWTEIMNQRDEIVTSYQGIDELFLGFSESREFALKCANYGILVGEIVEVPDVPRSVHIYGDVEYPDDITTLMDVYITRGLISEDEISNIQDSLVEQSLYWINQRETTGNPRYVFGGKILTWGCGVDCSGFVTILYRRALGTMIQPNANISGGVYNAGNYIQSMNSYGTITVDGRFYQNYPMNEGVFRTRDGRTVYVDRFGIASPILMNTYQWIYYLKQLGVSYTQVNMSGLDTSEDWSFLDEYQAGDIILWWDGKPFETTNGDSWHMAIYDGEGGVYQSSSMDTSFDPPAETNIGVEHSNITHIFPTAHDRRTIIIFHCFPYTEE